MFTTSSWITTGSTVRDMLQSREMAEQIDWRAKQNQCLCDFAGTLVLVPKSTECYWDVNLILWKQSAQVASISKSMKCCWGAWDTTCGHKAWKTSHHWGGERRRKRLRSTFHLKRRTRPLPITPTLERFQRQLMRQGGAQYTFPERFDSILNWTQLKS